MAKLRPKTRNPRYLTNAQVAKVRAYFAADGIAMPKVGWCTSLGPLGEVCRESAGYYLITDKSWESVLEAIGPKRNAPKNRLTRVRQKLMAVVPTSFKAHPYTMWRDGPDVFIHSRGKVFFQRQQGNEKDQQKFRAIGRAATLEDAKALAKQWEWHEGRSTQLHRASRPPKKTRRFGGTKHKVTRKHRFDLQKGMVVRTPARVKDENDRWILTKSFWPDAPKTLVVMYWHPGEGETWLKDPNGKNGLDMNILDYPEYFEVIE